jgi:hypothetical protein
MNRSSGETPKSVFVRVVAFQLARAAAEDAADAAWGGRGRSYLVPHVWRTGGSRSV